MASGLWLQVMAETAKQHTVNHDSQDYGLLLGFRDGKAVLVHNVTQEESQ